MPLLGLKMPPLGEAKGGHWPHLEAKGVKQPGKTTNQSYCMSTETSLQGRKQSKEQVTLLSSHKMQHHWDRQAAPYHDWQVLPCCLNKMYPASILSPTSSRRSCWSNGSLTSSPFKMNNLPFWDVILVEKDGLKIKFLPANTTSPHPRLFNRF